MLYLLLKCCQSNAQQSLPKYGTLINAKTNFNFLCHRWTSQKANDVKSASKATETSAKPLSGIPYKNLSVGVPKEVWSNERRVSLTPSAASVLVKKGITVKVENNAGYEAQFLNSDY